MATSEMHFVYFPAFLAQICDGKENPNGTKVRIWLQHPQSVDIQWCHKKTIAVDLGKTPSWAGNNPELWSKIEADDYCNHIIASQRGFTTMGPGAPHIYGAAGIYLSVSYLNRNRDDVNNALRRRESNTSALDAFVLRGRFFERLAYVVRENRTTRRFHGFYQFDKLSVIDKHRSLISVAHAGASFEPRAPRLLVASDDEFIYPKNEILIGDTQPQVQRFAGDKGEIFLSTSLIHGADLDVPKKPSGSGEGLYTQAAAACTHDLVQNGPLNVLANNSYDEVDRIRTKLGKNHFCIYKLGLDELFDIPSSSKFTSLDLIGHSNRDGALKLNELPFTSKTVPSIFHVRLVAHLRALGIKEVRLLGCRTANGTQAYETATVLYGLLNSDPYNNETIAVVATRADIFDVSYRQDAGFVDTRLLVSNDILCHGAARDCPPEDDLLTYPVSPSPDSLNGMPPIKGLPLARDTVFRANAYISLANANGVYNQILRFIAPNPIYTDTPYPPADLQVAIVDGADVRAFEIVLQIAPAETQPGTYNVDRVRLTTLNNSQSLTIMAMDPSSDLSPGEQLIEYIESMQMLRPHAQEAQNLPTPRSSNGAAPADRVGPGIG